MDRQRYTRENTNKQAKFVILIELKSRRRKNIKGVKRSTLMK